MVINLKNSALVWFVGVFSQLDLYSEDISTAVLNRNLINTICSSYSTVYCLICVKNKDEQFLFEKLVSDDSNLKKCKFIFLPYVNFKQVLIDCPSLGTVSTFIDSNSTRLWTMKSINPNVECLHISKFIN